MSEALERKSDEGLQNAVLALAKYITAKGDAWRDEFHLATEDDIRAAYE